MPRSVLFFSAEGAGAHCGGSHAVTTENISSQSLNNRYCLICIVVSTLWSFAQSRKCTILSPDGAVSEYYKGFKTNDSLEQTVRYSFERRWGVPPITPAGHAHLLPGHTVVLMSCPLLARSALLAPFFQCRCGADAVRALSWRSREASASSRAGAAWRRVCCHPLRSTRRRWRRRLGRPCCPKLARTTLVSPLTLEILPSSSLLMSSQPPPLSSLLLSTSSNSPVGVDLWTKLSIFVKLGKELDDEDSPNICRAGPIKEKESEVGVILGFTARKGLLV